jgi:hypothetical protein
MRFYEFKQKLDKLTLTVDQLAKKHSVPVEKIKSQLTKGMKVELEHTSDKKIAKEIALDHLKEFPDYYDRLAKAETNESASGYQPGPGVKIDAHREGDTLWINYFEVPTKRKGMGTTEYERFEKSLPKDIKKIRLHASDAGHGPTHSFWDMMGFDWAYNDDDNEMIKILEAASGYIPSNAQKNDPRYKTALTVDIKPDTLRKNAKAFGFKVSRAGIPPLLRK